MDPFSSNDNCKAPTFVKQFYQSRRTNSTKTWSCQGRDEGRKTDFAVNTDSYTVVSAYFFNSSKLKKLCNTVVLRNKTIFALRILII